MTATLCQLFLLGSLILAIVALTESTPGIYLIETRDGNSTGKLGHNVEELYCNRPIQCLASSKILPPPPPCLASSKYWPPPPPHRLASVCNPNLCWVERGWGVNILEDARHCSVLYICGSQDRLQNVWHKIIDLSINDGCCRFVCFLETSLTLCIKKPAVNRKITSIAYVYLATFATRTSVRLSYLEYN